MLLDHVFDLVHTEIRQVGGPLRATGAEAMNAVRLIASSPSPAGPPIRLRTSRSIRDPAVSARNRARVAGSSSLKPSLSPRLILVLLHPVAGVPQTHMILIGRASTIWGI